MREFSSQSAHEDGRSAADVFLVDIKRPGNEVQVGWNWKGPGYPQRQVGDCRTPSPASQAIDHDGLVLDATDLERAHRALQRNRGCISIWLQ